MTPSQYRLSTFEEATFCAIQSCLFSPFLWLFNWGFFRTYNFAAAPIICVLSFTSASPLFPSLTHRLSIPLSSIDLLLSRLQTLMLKQRSNHLVRCLLQSDMRSSLRPPLLRLSHSTFSQHDRSRKLCWTVVRSKLASVLELSEKDTHMRWLIESMPKPLNTTYDNSEHSSRSISLTNKMNGHWCPGKWQLQSDLYEIWSIESQLFWCGAEPSLWIPRSRCLKTFNAYSDYSSSLCCSRKAYE